MLLFNYRFELLVAHSVTVVTSTNCSQQSVKIVLKLNETEITKMGNGINFFETENHWPHILVNQCWANAGPVFQMVGQH